MWLVNQSNVDRVEDVLLVVDDTRRKEGGLHENCLRKKDFFSAL